VRGVKRGKKQSEGLVRVRCRKGKGAGQKRIAEGGGTERRKGSPPQRGVKKTKFFNEGEATKWKDT